MRGYGIRAETVAKVMRDALGEAARIHKNERGAMLAGEFGDAIVHLAPHFVGGYGAELASGHFDRQVKLALVTNVNDFGQWPIVADEEASDRLDRFLCGRKADANRRTGLQSL